MNMPEPDHRIEQNVQRAASHAALRKVRGIVDEELEKDAANARALRAFMRFGWIVLLAAAALLARYLGVI
jgi:hypothetical protein